VTGIGSLVAAKKTVVETTYYQYPQYDHRGTVVGLTDKTGAVIASYEYNAFGEVISADESAEVQAAGNRFRYQSNWMTLKDSGGRFYLSPTRVYDMTTARFLSRDHLRLSGRYLYAKDNPLGYVDANGLDPVSCSCGQSEQSGSSLDFSLDFRDTENIPGIPKLDTANANTRVDMDRLRKKIEAAEGRKAYAYDDPKGIRTIGIGHNLDEKSRTLDELNNISGLSQDDYCELYNGEKGLTNAQIDELFTLDLQPIEQELRGWLSNYDSLPGEAKEVLIGMHFNMGLNKLRGFKNMKKALEAKDFKTAADELFDSSGYGRSEYAGVRRRAAENRDTLRSLAQ